MMNETRQAMEHSVSSTAQGVSAGGARQGGAGLTALLAREAVPRRVLVIDGAGLRVGKHSERLRVSRESGVLEDVPLLDLEQVLIVGRGVTVSSDIVVACAERDIALDFVSVREGPQAALLPALPGATVRTRRAQFAAYGDARGAYLARTFAQGKLYNAARLLRYLAKNRHATDEGAYQRAASAAILIEGLARNVASVAGDDADSVRQGVLTLEGQGSELYWSTARALLLAAVEWERRDTRGAQDPVNSALNYGYAILYAQVQRAIVLAGLDPYGGFLHADRPGKPSLVLDMVEEFRQMVVDRCIYALFNKGVRMEMDEESGGLIAPSRYAIIDRVRERLDGDEPYDGRRYALRDIIQGQARRLAAYLRGERAAYEPFIGRW